MQDAAARRAHFAEVFRWSDEARLDRRQLLISLIAMAVPIAAGMWAGRVALGYVVALGAMLLSGEPGEGTGEGANDQRHRLTAALLPAILAVIAASAIVKFPMADAVMIGLVVCAATLVNYSRPAAISGIRFIVLLVLNLSLISGHGAHGQGAALMFGIGALWRAVLRWIARRRASAAGAAFSSSAAGDTASAADRPSSSPPVRVPTAHQRRVHWGRMLRSVQGWQYPLRLALGLAAACLTRDLWPRHHYDWIVLSIVLMTPRALEHLPVHITQRAIGTLAGVALAGAILHFAPGHGMIALLVCLFGAIAPSLRAGNYAAYCVFSTPLILLAMDAGGQVGNDMLADRLVATLAGSLIVVCANLLMDAALRWFTPAANR